MGLVFIYLKNINLYFIMVIIIKNIYMSANNIILYVYTFININRIYYETNYLIWSFK